ncbi:unnamed protein product, partial [Staurois parvus]
WSVRKVQKRDPWGKRHNGLGVGFLEGAAPEWVVPESAPHRHVPLLIPQHFQQGNSVATLALAPNNYYTCWRIWPKVHFVLPLLDIRPGYHG